MVFRSHNSTLCTSTHSTTSLAIHSSCCTKSNWLYELLFLLQTLSLNCPALRLGGLGQNRLPGWSVGFWKEENEERIEKGKVIETNTWLIAKLLALLWVLGHTMHFTCSNLKLSNDMHKREKSSKLLVVKTDSVGTLFQAHKHGSFWSPRPRFGGTESRLQNHGKTQVRVAVFSRLQSASPAEPSVGWWSDGGNWD